MRNKRPSGKIGLSPESSATAGAADNECYTRDFLEAAAGWEPEGGLIVWDDAVFSGEKVRLAPGVHWVIPTYNDLDEEFFGSVESSLTAERADPGSSGPSGVVSVGYVAYAEDLADAGASVQAKDDALWAMRYYNVGHGWAAFSARLRAMAEVCGGIGKPLQIDHGVHGEPWEDRCRSYFQFVAGEEDGWRAL